MAQQEQALWDTLELMLGRLSGWTTTEPNKEPIETKIENGIEEGQLRGELVLKYKPDDIEDTIYFMKYRQYFKIHYAGGGRGAWVVYSLSDKALEVARGGKLPEEEQRAFREKLWNLEPSMWGVSPNIAEIMRRAKNLVTKRDRNLNLEKRID